MAPSSSQQDRIVSSNNIDDSQPSKSNASNFLDQQDAQTTIATVDSAATSVRAAPSVREHVGEVMHMFTDIVNNNLIAARFGVFSSIVLLSAYGISNTPLFFRFRTVSEIPVSYFVNRRRLYGRIIGINKNHENNALQVYVRHLSPVGQVLPKAWFDFFMKASPLAGSSTQKPEESKNDLLRIEIAGVQYPSLAPYRQKPEEFLRALAKDRTLVSCQLLARQLPVEIKQLDLRKRKVGDVFPDLEKVVDNERSPADVGKLDEQLAVCKLSYRPSYAQLFSTDIATSLLLAGNADVSSSVFATTDSLSGESELGNMIVESSQRVDDLRKDAKYLESLAHAEYEALKAQKGMWAFEDARETKSDVLEEIDFQSNSNIFQKLWRRLRGG